MVKQVLILLSIFLLSCQPQEEYILKGKIVKVADGDTVTLIAENKEKVRIRLLGIDAPEKGQDYGTKARQYLSDLCYGKYVTVQYAEKDQYDRILGVVYVDGMNVNEEMVRQGLAWYYRHFVDDPRLDSLEQLARTEKRNIWSRKNPISPFEFRKKKRNRVGLIL